MEKEIVLYGGSFSPPHIGHASVIEAILRLAECDEIWVMPSADRHDKIITADGKNRIKMLQIMIDEIFPNPKIPIKITDFELKLKKSTVTYETFQALKEKYPDYKFHFVLGSDILNNVENKWRLGKRLYNETDFIIIKNPNIPLPQNMPSNYTILEDLIWISISSTFIRKLISHNFSGLPYLTIKVAEYINKNKLYK